MNYRIVRLTIDLTVRLTIDLTPGWLVILGSRVVGITRECDYLLEPRIIGQLRRHESEIN